MLEDVFKEKMCIVLSLCSFHCTGKDREPIKWDVIGFHTDIRYAREFSLGNSRKSFTVVASM